MKKMLDTLSRRPMIGITSGLGSSLFSFIEAISPVLQFVALILGIGVAGLTLLIKLKQYREML